MPYRAFHQNCPVAATLEVIGERWTPLVLREVFLGRRRFEEIQRGSGAATNIVADRLATLVEQGVLRKVPYGERSDRFEYRLTRKGADLAPVIQAILQWGTRYTAPPEGPARVLLHTACGHETEPVHVCSHCGEELDPREIRTGPGPGANEEQRAAGFLP